jgi:DNA invertase Pin-like site-specific DNA recombinase
MSTDRQETSIADQRAAVLEYAAKHGYKIIREYKDEGISGDATEKRKEFQRMIADAERGDFEVVLCWDQDRFGRFDPMEAGYWVKPLRDAGVRLETVAQGKIDWTDFAGRIIYAVQQEGKHQFLRDLSRNVVRGMVSKAKAGIWLGGVAPYGYSLADGKLVPVAKEAETVRWLFETYATTATSVRRLAHDLNERGVPAPGNHPRKRRLGRNGSRRDSNQPIRWNQNRVHALLTSRVYLGELVWNKRHEGKYHGYQAGEITKYSRRRWLKNSEGDKITTKDAHEALVAEPLFNKVQAKLLANRGQTTPRKKGDFLFTKLLFCNHCGSPMHGENQTRTKGGTYKYRRYICGAYNNNGKTACKCNTLLERTLLGVVVRKVCAWFRDGDNLKELRAEVRKALEAEHQPSNVNGLRRRLAELEKQISAGAERLLLVPEHAVPVVAQKLKEFQEERDKIKAELAKPAKPAPNLDADVGKAVEALGELADTIDQDDKAERLLLKEVLGELIERVDCNFRHVPYGKRQKSLIASGVITVKLPDLSHGPGPRSP